MVFEFGSKNSLFLLIRRSTKINKDTTGTEEDESKRIAHIFFSRNLLTTITIWNIIEPPPLMIPEFRSEMTQFHDASSAFTLVRNLFESYVNMHHLLIDNQNESERELKLLLWNRHYREERKKMAEFRSLKDIKLEKEKTEIEEINRKILQNQHYKTLKKGQQKHIEDNKNWSLLNFIERAKRSNIQEKQVQYMYKFLSNYAHSESFAIMQYSSIKNPNEAIETLHILPVAYAEALLSFTLEIFTTLFSEYKLKIKEDIFLLKCIESWKDFMSKER